MARRSNHNLPVPLSRRDADNILGATQRIQAQTYLQPVPQRQSYVIPYFGVVEATVTTAITAASGYYYGRGYAQIYLGDSDPTDAAVTDPNYPDPVQVRNWFQNSGTIAVGKHVLISNRGAYWLLGPGDC